MTPSKRFLLITMLCVPLLCGLGMSRCDVGGLSAEDFEPVSLNGFDPDDNQADKNSYAYSMEYFMADDAEEGHIYVGTGNNIFNLVLYYIQTLVAGGEITDAPVFPPEIRRYRPDLGPMEWETVLDYRDVEEDGEWQTLGFRFMIAMQAADEEDGPVDSTYLYAATQGVESALWRTKSGDYGDWEKVFAIGELGASIRWIEPHNGRIYAAVAYDSFGATPPPGQIWVSDDGIDFEPFMTDGFGNPNNRGVQALISWNGWLYAGTMNDTTGFEIWKLEGPESDEMVQVVANGGSSAHNENAGMPIAFKEHLYFGTQLYAGGINFNSGNAFQGCDIVRLDADDNWETIVGPDSLSGYESGFNHFTNVYLWWMEEHDGWLYAGTHDAGTTLSILIDNIDLVIEFFQNAGNKQAMDRILAFLDELWTLDDLYDMTHAGADIFKTCDGVHWFKVTTDGLGDHNNYGWRTMVSTPDNYFYIGSANPFNGLEIWRAGEGPEEEPVK